jgi:cytochrome P450
MLPDYDPRLLAHRRAPLDLLSPLREATPIAHNPAIGGWMLLRFDDVQEALRDQRLSNARIQSYAAHLRQRGQDPGPIADSLAHWMVFNDPPRQMELRLMVAKTFGTRSMARLRASIEEIVNRLIDRIEPGRQADLIADFAVPLPTLVIARLLGVPEADAPMLKAWSDEIALFVGTSLDVADRRQRAEQAVLAMRAYLEEQATSRAIDTDGTLIGTILRAELDGHPVTASEAADIALSIVFAGHETTTHLLGNGLSQLLSHPDAWQRLVARQLSPEDAVEECLRFEGPVNAVARVVREPHERLGQLLQPGERLFLMLGAANRDPRRFDNPDTFLPDRGDHRHLAFGFGTHFCLGALLARLEATTAIAALADRLPDLRLPTGEHDWLDSLVLRGMLNLPASF